MLKIGVIGTGGISGAHLRYLKTRSDAQIAALCDINPEALERRRAEFGGQPFADFRDMLERVKLDAVWLCTPPQVRGEPLVACAKKGVPVFCEKPVERSAERAAEIADELDRLGARVQIGYLFRSWPLVQKLRQEMRSDSIHLVQSFYSCDMSLKRTSGSWFYDKDKSGGALVDQATHNLDLLRYLLGEVEQLCGVATNPVHRKEPGYTIDEAISLSFIFRSGLVGSHIHTWVGDTWRNELFFSGEKRCYRLNLFGNRLTVEEGSETRQIVGPGRDMLEYEGELFLRQVSSGDWSANPSDYRDGLATLRLTLACDRAITEGPVKL